MGDVEGVVWHVGIGEVVSWYSLRESVEGGLF